jgi:hypothetical protein
MEYEHIPTFLEIITIFGGANRRCARAKTEAQAKYLIDEHSSRNDKWIDKHNRQVATLENRFASIGLDYSAICADERVKLQNGSLVVI